MGSREYSPKQNIEYLNLRIFVKVNRKSKIQEKTKKLKKRTRRKVEMQETGE